MWYGQCPYHTVLERSMCIYNRAWRNLDLACVVYQSPFSFSFSFAKKYNKGTKHKVKTAPSTLPKKCELTGKKKNKTRDKDTHRSVETPKNPAFAFVPGISTEQRRKVEERSASATVC